MAPAPVSAAFVCNAIPGIAPSMNEYFVTAPDGALWYTDANGNRLMRIGADFRASAVIPVDAQTSGLSGLAMGPDRQLWYTKTSGRIGHIPLDGGSGAELAIPDVKIPYTQGVVLGADGNLWLFDKVQQYVGRMSPQGAFTRFDGPHKGPFRPVGIAAAPDGGIWVTTEDNAVYRIDSVSGAYRRFDIATPNAFPHRLVVAADGTVWFTMEFVGKIGRITPAGAMTEFDASKSSVRFITIGADGAVWFTTSGMDLGRLDPASGSVELGRCASDLKAMTVGQDHRLYLLGNTRLWVVDDPMKPVQAAVVATSAVPSAPAAAVGPPVEIVRADHLAERLSRVPGRAVVQFTSNDRHCGHCIPATPTFDAVARRRGSPGVTFLRVLFEPWQTVGESVTFMRTGLGGVPGIGVYEHGQLLDKLGGNVDTASIDNFLDAAAPSSR